MYGDPFGTPAESDRQAVAFFKKQSQMACHLDEKGHVHDLDLCDIQITTKCLAHVESLPALKGLTFQGNSIDGEIGDVFDNSLQWQGF